MSRVLEVPDTYRTHSTEGVILWIHDRLTVLEEKMALSALEPKALPEEESKQ